MKKSSLANWTILAISLTLSLVAADGLFRLYERHALSISKQLDGNRFDLQKLNYNDTTVTRAKPEGEYRILGFGDSFGYSIMTPRYSYSGLVAKNLNETLETPRFRVVNLGEAASTVTDYAAAYGFWSTRIEHDAALFNVYMGNDLLDVAYGYTPVQWQPNRAFRDFEYHMIDGTKRSPVPRKYPLRIFDHLHALYLTTFQMEETAHSNSPPEEHFNLAATHNLTEEKFVQTNLIQLVNFDYSKIETLSAGYEAALAFLRYVSEIRQSGIRTIVTLAPNEIHVDQEFRERTAEAHGLDLSVYDFTLPARVLTAIRDRVDPKIDLIDLSPYFVCHSDRGESLYYLTNTHWGPEGNALAGKVIARYLWREWFNGSALPLDDGACDIEAYYSRFARISDSDVSRFVDTLMGHEHTTGRELFSENDVVADLACGSLDGIRVDEGDVFLWGWACDPRTKTPAIDVVVLGNGKPVSAKPATGLDRPDVVALLDDPALSATGWNLRIPSTELSAEEYLFEAYALLADGSYGRIPSEVEIRVTLKKVSD